MTGSDSTRQNSDHSFRREIRLNRAINYAHGIFADAISLDQLAHAACMSKYHFSRVFGDYVGESPFDFLSRVKLERAAYMLAFCRNWSITEVAGACGFSSGQTLARAFKNRFDFTPRDFRGKHIFQLTSSEADFESKRSFASSEKRFAGLKTSDHLDVKLVQQPDIRVAYIRNLGGYGSEGTISLACKTALEWAQSQEQLNRNAPLIGVSWDNVHITPERVCRYDACIPLPDSLPAPDNISVQTIPGGLYATVGVDPQGEEIPLIWERFLLSLKDWPGFKQLTLRVDRPYYEKYTDSGEYDSRKLDLYAPVSMTKQL